MWLLSSLLANVVAQLFGPLTYKQEGSSGYISDCVPGIVHNTSSHTMATGPTRPLTEICTKNISWGRGGGKGGRWVRVTNFPPSCADYFEIWDPQPSGTLRACPGFALLFIIIIIIITTKPG